MIWINYVSSCMTKISPFLLKKYELLIFYKIIWDFYWKIIYQISWKKRWKNHLKIYFFILRPVFLKLIRVKIRMNLLWDSSSMLLKFNWVSCLWDFQKIKKYLKTRMDLNGASEKKMFLDLITYISIGHYFRDTLYR